MDWKYIIGIASPVVLWAIKERKMIWSFLTRVFSNPEEVIKHKDELISHLRKEIEDLEADLDHEREKREKLQLKYEKQIIKSRGRK